MAAIAAAIGCGKDVPTIKPQDAAAATVDSSSAAFVRASFSASPATKLAAAKRVPWPITFEGAGPFQPGISLARAIVVMEGDLWTREVSLECSYFRAARAPGMKFLFLRRRLARIEVDSGQAATPEGIRIGSTEGAVMAAYPDRVTVRPDKYTEGHHTLIVRSADAADSVHRMVFETDGQRVRRFRTGIVPSIEWVEGCS